MGDASTRTRETGGTENTQRSGPYRHDDVVRDQTIGRLFAAVSSIACKRYSGPCLYLRVARMARECWSQDDYGAAVFLLAQVHGASVQCPALCGNESLLESLMLAMHEALRARGLGPVPATLAQALPHLAEQGVTISTLLAPVDMDGVDSWDPVILPPRPHSGSGVTSGSTSAEAPGSPLTPPARDARSGSR